MKYFVVYKVEKSVNIFETNNAIITRFESITTEDDILEIECFIADNYESCCNSDITLISYKLMSKDDSAIYLSYDEYQLLYGLLLDKINNLQSLIKNKFYSTDLTNLLSDSRIVSSLENEMKITKSVFEKVQNTRN